MRVMVEKVYDYSEAGKIGIIRKYGQVLSEEYKEDGIHLKAYVPSQIMDRI